MKVAINCENSLFALSDKAVERCLELGMKCTSYTPEREDGNPDDEIYLDPNADFVYIEKEDRPWLTSYETVTKFGENFAIEERKFRCNPVLISVIEELGEMASSGPFNCIRLVEIPFQGVEGWHIVEEEGYETIHEDHRVWEGKKYDTDELNSCDGNNK